MNINLKQQQTQKLVLSQSMLQAIDLLQCTQAELLEYLDQCALENPFLEVLAPSTLSIEAIQDPPQKLATSQTGFNEAYVPLDHQYATLEEDLLEQWNALNKSETMDKIGRWIIQSLHHDGYFRESLETITRFTKCTLCEAKEALGLVQSLEPRGVGARNLAECLELQLDPNETIAITICRHHLNNLEKKNLKAIVEQENITLIEAQQAFERISSLNPLPGNGYDTKNQTDFIIVDAIIHIKNNELAIKETSILPELELSTSVNAIYENALDPETKKYLDKKKREAEILIQNFTQRNTTIHRVIECICKYQIDFLRSGIDHLLPMRLIDIAEELNLHISTISRAIKGTYIETPQGILELRNLFTSSLGETVSPKAIKHELIKIIQAENPSKPLSDAKIQAIFEQRKIMISRRTIADYRAELGIPSTRERKKI
ncbi:RNA polymerase factor sigma-54 [Guggenheimella bovis]